jgi:hypothetical protein
MGTTLFLVLGPVATAAPSQNYGEYSLMGQRHAGQFYSGGIPAGQWSWTPLGDASEVVWGDPSKWPPDSVERFVHTGDGSCRNMVPLPSDEGRQHYVQWRIPPQAYCLQAWGTITDQSSGKNVDFFHSQIWSPPSSCRNDYLGEQTCIRQWESWSDNNGAPVGRSPGSWSAAFISLAVSAWAS